MNKRRHRTEQYHNAARRLVVAEEVSNRLEQHSFDKLVAQGMVVACGESMLKVEAGGRGRLGGALL